MIPTCSGRPIPVAAGGTVNSKQIGCWISKRLLCGDHQTVIIAAIFPLNFTRIDRLLTFPLQALARAFARSPALPPSRPSSPLRNRRRRLRRNRVDGRPRNRLQSNDVTRIFLVIDTFFLLECYLVARFFTHTLAPSLSLSRSVSVTARKSEKLTNRWLKSGATALANFPSSIADGALLPFWPAAAKINFTAYCHCHSRAVWRSTHQIAVIQEFVTRGPKTINRARGSIPLDRSTRTVLLERSSYCGKARRTTPPSDRDIRDCS